VPTAPAYRARFQNRLWSKYSIVMNEGCR